jgi:hypothetical protein
LAVHSYFPLEKAVHPLIFPCKQQLKKGENRQNFEQDVHAKALLIILQWIPGLPACRENPGR